MIEITWNKKTYTFPEKWDEMTEKQFISVTRNLGTLLFEEELSEEDIYAKRIIALQEMAEIPLWKFKKIRSDELVDLLKLLDFTKTIDLNKQLLPEISIGASDEKIKLIGPETGLKTSTFDEFIVADTHFVDISAKKDFDVAYLLFAVLYRPIREDLNDFKRSNEWNGDVREPFNITKCKERVPFLKKHLPKEFLVAVMYFYWGFREKNLLIYKTLFPKKEEDEANQPKKNKNPYGWADTRLELSGKKFGSYRETGKENWRNIIFDMHLNEEKRREREKRAAIERQRNKNR